MGQHWFKRECLPGDYYPDGVDLRPGAIRPGLYFELEADFDRFLADPGIERVSVERTFLGARESRPRAWPPITVDETLVRVATPEEAAWFRANPLPPPWMPSVVVAAACRVPGMPPPRPILMGPPSVSRPPAPPTNVIPFRIPARVKEAKDRGDR
jgi:hypothetical protein